MPARASARCRGCTWHEMLTVLESGLDVRGVITHRMAVDD